MLKSPRKTATVALMSAQALSSSFDAAFISLPMRGFAKEGVKEIESQSQTEEGSIVFGSLTLTTALVQRDSLTSNPRGRPIPVGSTRPG